MELQEKNYCCEKKEKEPKRINCIELIAIILFSLFLGVVGVLIGAAIAATIAAALPAVIVLAIILGLLFILSLILIFCNRRKDKKCEYKCCK